MARPATGAVVQSKTGAYALRFTAYKERRYVTLGTEAEGWTRDRAEAELQNVMADVRRGRWTPPHPAVESEPASSGDPTFHVFASEWFAGRQSAGLAQNTLDAIRGRLCDVLLPHFAGYRLSQITVEEVDRYRTAQVRERDRLTAARDRGEDIPRRPLSNNTINRTIQLLAQVLELAVEYGHIPTNPATGKRRKLPGVTPRRAYLDSADQITALLDAAGEMDRESRADRQHVNRRGQLATLIFAGPRISEMLALRWGDVDLAGGWLTVRDSKTAAGRDRKVTLRPVLRDVLAAHKAQASTIDPGAYVFGTAQGKPQGPGNVRTRVLARAVERANARLAEAGGPPLPRVTPHGLRRTFASVLYALNTDPGEVMDEMGHNDPELALQVYRQSMRREPGDKDRLRALVEGAPIGSNGSGADFEAPARTPERVR
jgi:integrase